MRKIISGILCCCMLFGSMPFMSHAAETNDISTFELPTPEAPNYFVYTDGDASEGQHDDLRMFRVADPEVAALAAEYYNDSDAFYEKYGLWYFNIVMQYDVSLDGEENWQHTAEWDEDYYGSGGYGSGHPYNSIADEQIEDFEFFWLTYHEGQGSDTFLPYQPAILTYMKQWSDWEEEIYSFDVENHSLYIRCRYYMEWEPCLENEDGYYPGEKQSKFSDWSESAVFGKNSTQIIPEEPTTYEAPVISDLKLTYWDAEDERGHLEYVQSTPESVWMTYLYYMMMGGGEFDGLETQVSIDGGEWIRFDTADAGDDWCVSNGTRGAYNDEVILEEDNFVRLRIRFLGTHGPSPWSNVIEAYGGERPPVTKVFGDVYTDWYTEYVQYVYDNELMTGIKGTTWFDPHENITKAQVAQVLYNMESQPIITDRAAFTELKDVYEWEWYAEAVAWAYSTGVVTGDLDTNRFNPNTNVTREQLALMMFRYAKYKNYDVTATSDFAGLANAHKVSDWSMDGMKWAVGKGLISGAVKNGVKDLDPQGNASRAQVAAILQRFCEAYER